MCCWWLFSPCGERSPGRSSIPPPKTKRILFRRSGCRLYRKSIRIRCCATIPIRFSKGGAESSGERAGPACPPQKAGCPSGTSCLYPFGYDGFREACFSHPDIRGPSIRTERGRVGRRIHPSRMRSGLFVPREEGGCLRCQTLRLRW